MSKLTQLHEALLELGLEDQIPLPEIAQTQEVRDLQGDYPFEEIASALADLLREGRIQVWMGRWPDEPVIVKDDVAETLLRDERRYSFGAEAGGDLGRVYFSNVENLRG